LRHEKNEKGRFTILTNLTPVYSIQRRKHRKVPTIKEGNW